MVSGSESDVVNIISCVPPWSITTIELCSLILPFPMKARYVDDLESL